MGLVLRRHSCQIIAWKYEGIWEIYFSLLSSRILPRRFCLNNNKTKKHVVFPAHSTDIQTDTIVRNEKRLHCKKRSARTVVVVGKSQSVTAVSIEGKHQTA